MAIDIITPPAAEPITVEEAKHHLRVIGPDDDAQIGAMITAARVMVENRLNRALMPQTIRATADAFGGYVVLPRPPLLGVTSVSYVDSTGATQTLAPGGYVVDTTREPPRLNAPYGVAWPDTRAQRGAVTVTYQAGYPDAASVPAPIKQWMLLAIASMYAHRESMTAGVQVYPLPDDFIAWLLQPYMVYR